MQMQYYPIPFFNVDKEGNLKLSNEWPVYKEFLNNDLPINNLLNSVNTLVDKIGMDRARDLVPSNVLSLVGNNKVPYHLSSAVTTIYQHALQLPSLFLTPIPMLTNNQSITLSREQVQCLLAHKILSIITPTVVDGVIQFNSKLLTENQIKAEKQGMNMWFNSLLLYFSCISKPNYDNKQEFISYTRKKSNVIPKWEECERTLNELTITTGKDILEKPLYNHIIENDPFIGLGTGTWKEETVLSSLSVELMLLSDLTKNIGLKGFEYIFTSGTETGKVILDGLSSNDEEYNVYKDGDIIEGVLQTNYMFYRRQVKKVKFENYERIVYNEIESEKELNEIYNSYLCTCNNKYPIIAMKNNEMNEELSLILKWMSSSINNKKLFYVTNRPGSLNMHFKNIYNKMYNKMKVKDLHRIVKQYNEMKMVNKEINSLFKFINRCL